MISVHERITELLFDDKLVQSCNNIMLQREREGFVTLPQLFLFSIFDIAHSLTVIAIGGKEIFLRNLQYLMLQMIHRLVT